MNPVSSQAGSGGGAESRVRVTLAGLPLSIRLEWPFHRSTSGADFYVLHGDVRLESGEGLHALVAVQLTLTVREVLPSLEARDAETLVLNCLRKETDRKQMEFLKSPKRLPVSFNSRMYDFARQRWAFAEAGEEQIATLLARTVYWQHKLHGGKVLITDAADAQYLGTSPERLLEMAKRMPDLLALEGEHAGATAALLAGGEGIEADMRRAMADLERKHAFERG